MILVSFLIGSSEKKIGTDTNARVKLCLRECKLFSYQTLVILSEVSYASDYKLDRLI